MGLLEKRSIRFVMCIASIWLLSLCESEYLGVSSQKTLSIYGRYPLLVIVLGLIWLMGLVMNKKVLEVFSYVLLHLLLIYRLFFEMERFFPFNFKNYSYFDYVMYSISTMIFAIYIVFHVLYFIIRKTQNIQS